MNINICNFFANNHFKSLLVFTHTRNQGFYVMIINDTMRQHFRGEQDAWICVCVFILLKRGLRGRWVPPVHIWVRKSGGGAMLGRWFFSSFVTYFFLWKVGRPMVGGYFGEQKNTRVPFFEVRKSPGPHALTMAMKKNLRGNLGQRGCRDEKEVPMGERI